MTITIPWFVSASQEAAADKACASILSSLNLTGKSDFEKVKAIYNWLTYHVTYDHAKPDISHSSYAALVKHHAVCQGFASAFYRLCLSAGVNCRVVCGDSGGEGHAWNIAQLGGYWYYNLDATWDRYEKRAGNWKYFLKGSSSFNSSHSRWSDYTSSAFTSSHPTSSTDYPTSPTKITNLRASVSGNTVKLSWTGLSGTDYYEIWRSTSSITGFSKIGTCHGTSVSLSNQNYGTTYYFKVRSRKTTGKVSDFTEVKAVIGNGTVSGLKATVSKNTVKLSWNPHTNKGYEIWRSNSASTGFSKVGSCYASSASFSGLEYGHTYYYKVRGKMPNGQYSNYSAVIKVVTGNGQISSITSKVSGNSVKLTWSALPGRKQYEIWRSNSANTGYAKLGTCYGTTATYYGLEYGHTYYYKVRALLMNGQYSSYSAAIKVVTGNGQISSINSNVSGNSVKLTWSALPGRKQYEIWRSTSATTGYTKLGTCYGTTANYSGLEYGRTYYYKVRALLMNGQYSGYSAILKAVMGNGQVSGLKASVNGTSVKLSWNALPGRVKYEIWRATSSSEYVKLGTCYGTTVNFSGLTGGTTYYYKVRALLTDNKYSNYSTAVTAVSPSYSQGNSETITEVCSEDGSTCTITEKVCTETECTILSKVCVVVGDQKACADPVVTVVPVLTETPAVTDIPTATAVPTADVTEVCSEDGTSCTITEKVCTQTDCTITSKVCVIVGDQKACADPVVTVVPVLTETPAVTDMPTATAVPTAEVTEVCSEDGTSCTISEKVCTESMCTITSKVCVIVGDQKACADPVVTVVPVLTETPAATEEPTAEPALTETTAATEESTAEPALTETPAATEESTAEPALTETTAATEEPTAEPALTETPAATEEPTAEPALTETPAATEEPTAEPAVTETPAATEEPTAEPALTETPAATEEPAVEPAVTETPAATEDLTIREISVADLTDDTITFSAQEEYVIAPDKLKVVPEGADWATLSFKLDDETPAAFKTTDIEVIKSEGLTIRGLVSGSTTLRIQAGDVEKTITLVINLSAADIQATQEAEAAAQAAAEAEAAAQAAAQAEAAAQAAAQAEAAAQAAAQAEAAAQATAQAVTPEPAAE